MPFDDEDSGWDERMPYPPNWNQKQNNKKETPMNDNKTNPADYICSDLDCPCQPTELTDKQKIVFLLGICARTAQALEAKGLGESWVLSAFAVEALETVKIMPTDVLAEGGEATDELIDSARRIVADPDLRACALMAVRLMAGR